MESGVLDEVDWLFVCVALGPPGIMVNGMENVGEPEPEETESVGEEDELEPELVPVDEEEPVDMAGGGARDGEQGVGSVGGLSGHSGRDRRKSARRSS